MKGYILGFLFLAGSIWLLLAFSSSAPGDSFQGPLAPMNPEEEDSASRISATCESLVQDVGPRGAHTPGSQQGMESFLLQQLRHMRLEPTEIVLDCAGTPGKAFEVMLPGRTLGRETIVLGAHLDSPAGSPGADDNASGCAVLLEVLQILGVGTYDRTLRFVFWTGGAAPLAGTDKSTAWAYAQRLHGRHERVAAVLIFDSLGAYSEAPGTEMIPFPFGYSFPERGNFVAFLGDWGSHEVMNHALEQFRISCKFPSQGVSLPSSFDYISDSDDASFREAGFPALRLTDTGAWRNPAVGTKGDVLGLLDYDRMGRLARGFSNMVVNLAKRTTPLM